METAFGIVLFVIVGLGILGALWGAAGSGQLYRQIGRGGLSLDRDDDVRRPAGAGATRAEADAEIRQMLRARNERRAARGQSPVDVEAELERLTAPAADPALEAEVRALVIARNERRARQGRPPLDVEAEVRRQLAELTGS